MWRRPLTFIDNLTARLFSERIVSRIVAKAEILAQHRPIVYNWLLTGYAVFGFVLVTTFVSGLVFSIPFATAVLPLILLLSSPGSTQDLGDLADPAPVTAYFQAIWSDTQSEMLGTLGHILPLVILLPAIVIFARSRMRPPGGLLLLRSEAPKLFDLIDEVSTKFGTTVDKVYLTDQFNCAVVAIPGLIGAKHFLYIGYPSLACISVDQLKAILAHEAAHLTLKHSQSATMMQQQRVGWFTLMMRWRHKFPPVYILFNLLFFWYTPIFGALSFVRAKQHEFDADDRASANAEPEIYANALLNFVVKQQLFTKAFGQQLAQNKIDSDNEGTNIFKESIKVSENATPEELREIWNHLRENDDDGMAHTHPCLVRRLQRLKHMPFGDTANWNPDWQAVLEHDAPKAVTLLGECAERVERRMSSAFSDKKLSHNVSRESAHVVRGVAHYKAQRFDEAMEDFELALKLNPYSTSGLVSRSSIHIERGLYQKAIDDLDKAIALNPGSAVAFANRACAYGRLSRWDEAIRDASAALKLSPTNATAHVVRSEAYKALNKLDEALADLSRSIELTPNSPHNYLLRAALYSKADRVDDAIGDLDRYLGFNPKDTSAFFLRGSLYHSKELKDAALADYAKAIEADASWGDPFVCRAVITIDEDKDGARKDFESSLLLPLRADATIANRSYVANVLGEWKQAVHDAEVSYNRGNRDPFLLANYARGLHELGKDRQALPLIEQALKTEKDHPRIVANRARIRHALKRHEDALTDIDRAIELEHCPEFFKVRASIYRELGRNAEAEADEAAANVEKVQAPAAPAPV